MGCRRAPLAADHRALVERLVEEREQQIRAHHVGPSDVTRRVELLWVHSTPTFAVWCERRHAATLAARVSELLADPGRGGRLAEQAAGTLEQRYTPAVVAPASISVRNAAF